MNTRTPPILLTPTPSKTAAEPDAGNAAPIADIAAEAEAPARPRLDPTRYGDWELNGKCVDF